MSWLSIVSDALSIVAGVLAILIVKGIDDRQEEKNRRLIIDKGLQDKLEAGTGV